ncbi:unnamed protein product [Spodoptera littoralis]|uniref:Endonuclease-reverse transcriptase n=1 Tax=Spodoptera littoralis TaxID=7109 RepID=A0A9P0I0Y2_SPOLI|nr:unnamed protein product [Spodoptera littoralis]CAH1639102.1 unnamed protein product [Spodoptera littoralis]
MEEQFQMLFDKMKIEIKNQTAELTESISNTIMCRMEEKLQPIIEENKLLKTTVEKLQNEVKQLKWEKRSKNIVIFGLKEGENSTSELLKKIKEVFQHDARLVIEDCDVNKVHRIGEGKSNDKPRPILFSFVSHMKKAEILANKKKLKEVYITEDYPKEVLEKRKALLPKLKEERNKGNLAYLKFDKLVVRENNQNKEKRKRESSTSPQFNLQPRKQQNITASKTNRINAFDIMRNRSNSFSTLSGNNQ